MAQDRERQHQRNGRNAGGERRGPSRAQLATRHIAQMGQLFSAEIAASLAGTREVSGMPAAPAREGVVPQVEVVEEDSTSAVLRLGRGIASRCDMAMLDFASFVNPGGGYERGAWAQEEALCSESFLYNVLSQKRDWYGENRRRNINCELYRNRALVVPAVRFERDKYHSYSDVIVCAAPNAVRARANYHVADDALLTAMRERIAFVMAIADQLGYEKLVLGAFGCGAFGWDAPTVAELFRAELASGTHVASKVTFPVPRGRADENLEVFQHALATFPEKNDAPYQSRAELAAKRVSQRASEAEDAKDEDDWRKYL
ncbi:TIGR02452 family protein [Tractidigestivibacter montrealensis]|uniref:TIGR02452 family protein n=2 Tax=Tractidigestivibacter TaxID=2847313 RepID=A0ABT1Z768_9ACTN|nr:TIGR02452 family protein [Tractidigestivibacter montrealensis]MCR9036055.1 TIGR02452 family protein [Tractidigestivibacter montrealensis]